MKKIFKNLKEYFAPIDKLFFIGFTLLTIATFDLNFHWVVATLAGYSFIYWQRKYGMWRQSK